MSRLFVVLGVCAAAALCAFLALSGHGVQVVAPSERLLHKATEKSREPVPARTSPAPPLEPSTPSAVVEVDVPRPQDVFDKSGLLLMAQERRLIRTKEFFTVLFRPGPFRAQVNKNHDIFWTLVSMRKWEPHTFELIKQYVTNETVVIDFGCWVGPTLLYSAFLAKQVWGIEGDPAAYAEVTANLKQNPSLMHNTHVVPGVVLAKSHSEKLKMHSKAAGNAMSSLGAVYQEANPKIKWKVAGKTLPQYFEKVFRLEPSSYDGHVWIKIDTESYECELVPALLSWIKTFRRKPTLYLSLHAPIKECTKEQYDEIFKLCSLYRFHSPDVCEKRLKTDEFIFSDVKAPKKVKITV